MAKRFIFRSAPGGPSPTDPGMKRYDFHRFASSRKFAEPSREQIQKAKETWKRLAPKEAKGMIK